jgi:hypothetical protein
MSPDPSGLAYADPRNPQSLNLYSYALNNPLKNTDPTGMYCDYGDPDNDADMRDASANRFDYQSSQSECETADENGNKGKWVWSARSFVPVRVISLARLSLSIDSRRRGCGEVGSA